MRLILIFFLFFSLNSVLAQSKRFTSDSDTTFWYNYYEETLSEIGLKTLYHSEADYSFRFYDGRMIVQLERFNGELRGQIFLFLMEVGGEDDNYKGKIHHSHLDLSGEATSQVKYLVDDLEIETIPSDKFIEDWVQTGLDGHTYFIEHSSGDSLSFKNYWSPAYHRHKQIREARFIRYFIDQLFKIEEINSAFGFMEKQPFKSYYQFIGSSVSVVELR